MTSSSQKMSPFEIVDEFERRMAEYCGSRFAVAVHSCTDALLLSFWLRRVQGYTREAIMPRHTYVGVAYSALNAGFKIEFVEGDWNWIGEYPIIPLNIMDSARWLRRGMHFQGLLTCLSFHWYKHLPIGRGGMILTDDPEEARILKCMRYDGRSAGVHPTKDDFKYPGFHCYMAGDDAWQGIRLLENLPNYNDPIPWDDYDDLSRHKLFQEGYDGYGL